MEAYLMENGDILKLDAQNFADVTILEAEIALKSGRKTSDRDGRIDILAQYGLDYLSIVELKINEINAQTLTQLEDYLSEREQIITKYPEFWVDQNNKPNWVGVLIGTSISPELQRKLQDGYQTTDGIPIAGMVIRRFRSNKNEIFVITDTFFKFNYTRRDFSKFVFKGEVLNKSRLVNKVIKAFVEDHPTIRYVELDRLFPQQLQGSIGVLTSIESAHAINDKTGYKRHYIKPDELIKTSDSIIATSTQWGKDNIQNFINHVNKMEWVNKIENK